LSLVNTQYHKFGEVPKSYNRYYYGYGYSGYYDDYYYDLQEEYYSKGEVMFYDGYDTFGNVVGSTVAGFVSIYQAGNDVNTAGQEVFLDESNFRRLIDQYCLVTGYKVGSQLKKEKEQQQMDDVLNAIINEEPIKYNGKYYTTNANGELVPMADCF